MFNPADSSNLVARFLSELKGKSEYLIAAPSMAATGEGLLSLPKRCVLTGEFIDFAELPPAKGKVKSIPHAMEGQIVVIQAADLAESRKLIPDLATWIQCFSIYAAVIITKEPERAKNLLAYMSLIAKCSLKYKWPSWVVYDLNVRQDAAEVAQKSSLAPIRSASQGWQLAKKAGAGAAIRLTMPQMPAQLSLQACRGSVKVSHLVLPSLLRSGQPRTAILKSAENITPMTGIADMEPTVCSNINVRAAGSMVTLPPGAQRSRKKTCNHNSRAAAKLVLTPSKSYRLVGTGYLIGAL